MDGSTVRSWVQGLGQNYGALLLRKVIVKEKLMPLFDSYDNEELVCDPVPGVTLWFWSETKVLEKIMITLIETVGQPVYKGMLPAPFSLDMDQTGVRNILGGPIAVKRPGRLPGGLGMRGGSDTYYLDPVEYPNTKVTLSYLESLKVNNISFSLINKGRA